MNMTTEQILEKLNKRIDYKEVKRILELDLNTIAQEVIEDPQELIQFEVFFEYGEFDTAIAAQVPGDGPGFFITPVLLSLVGGDYATETGPQIFQTQFRIEGFGFVKDKENLRKVFEIYSSLNQGAVSTGVFANAMTTSVMDFPVFSEALQYKGFDRISVFMSWLMTFIYSGQLANEVEITLDDDTLNLIDLSIKRVRIGDSAHLNNQMETFTINKSQLLVFTGYMIYDGTVASKKIMREIKNLNNGLNNQMELKVVYPAITEDEEPELDTYNVILTEGDIKITEGGYLNLTFALALA